MNKQDLVNKVATGGDLSKAAAGEVIGLVFDTIAKALKAGDSVALPGFGTFAVSQRQARTGRNPQTGATIKIAARKAVKFRSGKNLKEMLNGKSKK